MKSLKELRRYESLTKVISLRPLRKDDPLLIHKSILRSLLADVNRLRPGTKGLGRDLVTLEARLEHEGVGFLAVTLGTLGKALDKGLADGTFSCPLSFKRAKGSKIPLLYSGVLGDVFNPSTGELDRSRDCREDVFILRQLLYFLAEVRDGCSSNEEARAVYAPYLQES